MSLMVGRLCSFWDGLCTGAMLVSGKVDPHSVHQKNVAWKLRMGVPKGDDRFCLKVNIKSLKPSGFQKFNSTKGNLQ